MQSPMSPMRLKFVQMEPDGRFLVRTLEWTESKVEGNRVERICVVDALPVDVLIQLLDEMSEGLHNAQAHWSDREFLFVEGVLVA